MTGTGTWFMRFGEANRKAEHRKCRRDPSQLGNLIVEIATDQVEDRPPRPEKHHPSRLGPSPRVSPRGWVSSSEPSLAITRPALGGRFAP
jgi:hypothetical protein